MDMHKASILCADAQREHVVSANHTFYVCMPPHPACAGTALPQHHNVGNSHDHAGCHVECAKSGAECRAGVAGLWDENLAVQVVRVPCAVHADSGAIFHERKCPIPTPLVYKRLVPAVHRFLPCHTPACMWACWCRPRSCHK